MNILDFIKAPIQWSLLAVCNLVLCVLGLFMVAIAIPFRVWDFSVSDGRVIANLPQWAHIWGNDFDGLLGDKRNWWADNTPFGVDVGSFLAMWWWAAIRNPANNMRRYSVFQARILDSKITYIGDRVVEDDPGKGGWQFVKLVEYEGRSRYGFYWVWQYSALRGFVIRLGFKVVPDHQDRIEQPKGLTIRVNPWKKL